MGAADEQHLVQDARDGDRQAFRMLVERYMKHAYSIAYGYVQNHDDAADVAQEAFVRVWHALSSFRGDAVFSTWLYRIVTNLALNRIRKNKSVMRHEVPLNEAPAMAGATRFDAYEADRHELLEEALHELPTLQRAVVILRHLNGLSTRQVSSILKCSEGTVKTHLHRGLKKLRSKLEFLNEHD